MKLYILLTNYPNRLSLFIRRLGGWRFSHVSISTSSFNCEFFSFTGKRGFILEKPLLHPKFKGREIECAFYEIEIPDEIGAALNEKLKKYAAAPDFYKYSYFGLMMMYLGVHAHAKNAHTCCSFVTDTLMGANIFSVKFCRKLINPNDFFIQFRQYKKFQGPLEKLIERHFKEQARLRE